MMKKSKIAIGVLSLTLGLALVTGCGSSDKQTTQQPAGQQQMSGHEGHNMNMPKEDPMPMVKDLEKGLQDITKQVKAGQTLDAQKTAGQLASTAEKIVPHMMDDGLKTKLRSGVADIKNAVNSGKADPSAVETKVKALQDVVKQTTTHLQSMSH